MEKFEKTINQGMTLQTESRFSSVLAFSLLGSVFFLYLFLSLPRPAKLVWDENIYINTANAILNSSRPYPTPEHPPFGKQVLAFGIKTFGNNVVGWRFFSVFCGALTMTLICHLIYSFTRRWGVTLFLGFLLLLDPFLLVHFRLGMLESILTALLVLASDLAIQFYRSSKIRWSLFLGTAFFLGLALSTKLLGLVFLPILFALFVYRLWKEKFSFSKIFFALTTFLAVQIGVFFLCYALWGYSPKETLQEFQFMLRFHSVYHGPTPSMSQWYEWLYLRHPIWYFFRNLPDGKVQSVVATGNFVLWIAAEISMLYVLIRRYKSPEIWALALLVMSQFALYSQKYTTFIHYMTEILPFLYVFLGLAIADLWERYGKRSARILQIDFALFAVVASLIYWKNVPYVWAIPVTKEAYFQFQGKSSRHIQP